LSEFPAVFHIIDPMAERMAWESAMPLDKSFQRSGVVQCGFHSMGERFSIVFLKASKILVLKIRFK